MKTQSNNGQITKHSYITTMLQKPGTLWTSPAYDGILRYNKYSACEILFLEN